jgi:hypothetical protein
MRLSGDGNVYTYYVADGSDGQNWAKNIATGEEKLLSINRCGELANWQDLGVFTGGINFDGSLFSLVTDASNFAPPGVTLPIYLSEDPDTEEYTRISYYTQVYVVPFDRGEVTGTCSVPPVTTSVSFTTNPLQRGQNTTLTAATDVQATGAEYFIGTDPGEGNGTAMTASGGIWDATFGSSLDVGIYEVGVRANDSGLWGTVKIVTLVVYDAANGEVDGKAKYVPSASDILPVTRDMPPNPNKATKVELEFKKVRPPKNGNPAAGKFDITYKVSNKWRFVTSDSTIDWVVVPDDTHAVILGHAVMTVEENNVTTIHNVAVRFDITLGTGGAQDHIKTSIFDEGADPYMDPPTWYMEDDSTGGNLKIKN